MSETRNLSWDEASPTPPLRSGTNHLLAIGIDAYQHCTPLNNAVKDAKDLVNILEQQYDFSAEQTHLLLNEEASEYRIFAEFRKLIQQVGPEDNVLIFFSGHGHYDGDFRQGYWVPVDARPEAVGDFIPNSEIATAIRAIPSQHTFMIADACFSGSLFGESRSIYSKEIPAFYYQKVGAMRSRWGLASGRNELVSDGTKGENSPFTQNLIYFLNTNANQPFAVSELVQFVKTATANNSEQTPIGSPLRNVGDKGGEMVFYPATFESSTVSASASTAFKSTATPSDPRFRPKPEAGLHAHVGRRMLNWLQRHLNLLVLIAFCTVFGGLWSSMLYTIIPLTAFSIIAVAAFFRLKGLVKSITSIAISVIVVIEIILYDQENMREAYANFTERTQGHEFLWFSLCLGCYLGFLYSFLREDR